MVQLNHVIAFNISLTLSYITLTYIHGLMFSKTFTINQKLLLKVINVLGDFYNKHKVTRSYNKKSIDVTHKLITTIHEVYAKQNNTPFLVFFIRNTMLRFDKNI